MALSEENNRLNKLALKMLQIERQRRALEFYTEWYEYAEILGWV